MKVILRAIRLFFQKRKLRHLHVSLGDKTLINNETFFEGYNVIGNNVVISGSQIGRNSYIGSGSKLKYCQIGRFCSIASNVCVIAENHPLQLFVSTSPLFYSTKNQCGHLFVEKDGFEEYLQVEGRRAIIGNDVWIGDSVLIKGGVRIGNGAILAMGAIVTHDVPPFAIVAGVPAKIVRYRFNEKQIDFLLRDKWWNKTDQWLQDNVHYMSNIISYQMKVEEQNDTN